jgi:16S rRNA (guanine966-N2)-methyltransferase
MRKAAKLTGVPARRATAARQAEQARELRIVGGRWRGRRWRFPDHDVAAHALRPTPDRVRETLFNWLQPHIVGARCLDLFAGSGALGLEAHSRGAASVSFVESDARNARAIRDLLSQWGASNTRVEHCKASDYLAQRARGSDQVHDLVFLDPPFAADLLESTADALTRGGWLTGGALLYVEHAREAPAPRLPPSWARLKTGNAGAVSYHLYRHQTLAKDSPR